MHPFHERAGLRTLIGRPFRRAVEELIAAVDAAPGAAQGGQVCAADALPAVEAGLQQALVPEELVRLGEARQTAVHLVDLAVADQRDVVILDQQRDQLQAGGLVHLLDAFVDQRPYFGLGTQLVQVAERIQHAAARHAAVHAGLGDLDALVKDGPVQEFGQAQRAVGVFRVAGRHGRFGETLDQIGDDPGVPVHHHRFRGRAVVEALVLPVAAQVAVFFLE